MHKNKIALSLLPIILILCLCAFDCSHKAAVSARDLAVSVSAFQDAEVKFHDQKRVSDAEHGKIQSGLEQIGIAGQKVDGCIKAATVDSQKVKCVDIGIDATNSFIQSDISPVKDELSRQQLQVAAQSILLFWNNLKGVL